MRAAALVFFVICQFGCRQTERQQITVGAASNLTEVFQKLIPLFEKKTGIHAVCSFASTAQLTRQIENGAPFDVFASADTEHAELLERNGLLLPRSRVVFAEGTLALWIPGGSSAKVIRLQELASAAVRVIAVANPELAPYGQASIDALRASGIWSQTEPKIVYAENIRMARQFGATGNADAVFTAYSLVMNELGKVIVVDRSLHRALNQEAGILASSTHAKEANQFLEFLRGEQARALLRSYGYRVDL